MFIRKLSTNNKKYLLEKVYTDKKNKNKIKIIILKRIDWLRI